MAGRTAARGRTTAMVAATAVLVACGSPVEDDVPEANAFYANIQGTVGPGTAGDLSALQVLLRLEHAGFCEEDQTGLAWELPVNGLGAFSLMPLVVDPGVEAMGICLVFQLRDGAGGELGSVTLDQVAVYGQPVTPDTLFVELP